MTRSPYRTYGGVGESAKLIKKMAKLEIKVPWNISTGKLKDLMQLYKAALKQAASPVGDFAVRYGAEFALSCQLSRKDARK